MGMMDKVPNLFTETQTIEDENVVKIGKIKTVTFIFCFLLSMIMTAAFYGTSTFTALDIEESPSYARYTELASTHESVTCHCENVSTKLSQYLDGVKEESVFCTEAVRVKEDVCLGTFGDSCAADSGDAFYEFISSLELFCEIADWLLVTITDALWKQIIVSDTLLASHVISERADAMTATAINTMKAAIASGEIHVSAFGSTDRPQVTPVGDAIVFDDGCSCADVWSCKKQINDDQGNFIGNVHCSLYDTIMKNDLKVWQEENFWRGIGMDCDDPDPVECPLSLYTTHATEGILFDMSTSAFKDDKFEEVYVNGMASTLKTDKDYEAYFNVCAPTTCEYTVERKRSGVEIIVVLLGLIGGFKAVCDLLVNAMFSSKSAKAKETYRNSVMNIKVPVESDNSNKVSPEAQPKEEAANADYTY